MVIESITKMFKLFENLQVKVEFQKWTRRFTIRILTQFKKKKKKKKKKK